MNLNFIYVFVFLSSSVLAQHHEDKRCRCICPSPAAVLNHSMRTDRQLFVVNVPPSKCNCDGVILPRVGHEISEHEQEYCARCECKYESRNTTVIMVVVVMVVWVTTLLIVYMGFLKCLNPLISRRKVKFYREHGSEEVMERIINTQLLGYLEDNDFIRDHQYGFRHCCSTGDLLVHLTHRWVRLYRVSRRAKKWKKDFKKANPTTFP